MSNSPSLSDALAQMQSTQQACEDATEKLLSHNTDLEAHPDIRSLLDKLFASDQIYTKDQIDTIINEKLRFHINAEPRDAHKKIADQIDELVAAVSELSMRLESVEQWMHAGTQPGEETNLTAAIQKVIDEYAPIIRPLRDALDEAIQAGQTESAAALQESLNRVLDEQTAKIKEVIDQYRQDNTPSVGE